MNNPLNSFIYPLFPYYKKNSDEKYLPHNLKVSTSLLSLQSQLTQDSGEKGTKAQRFSKTLNNNKLPKKSFLLEKSQNENFDDEQFSNDKQKSLQLLNNDLFSRGDYFASKDRFHSRIPFTTPVNKLNPDKFSYYLLEPKTKKNPKKTLVLNLIGTLVNFNKLFDINEIQMSTRPQLKHFLTKMKRIYEIVIFSDLAKKETVSYLQKLEMDKYIDHILSRENCKIIGNNYVKCLNNLGRELKDTIIVDVRKYNL